MKYTLTGYVDLWDNTGILINEYSKIEDAQKGARQYMRDNSYHGYKKIVIDPVGDYTYWTIKYIYDGLDGWEQY